MKHFEMPDIQVEIFETEDIMTTSGGNAPGPVPSGDGWL